MTFSGKVGNGQSNNRLNFGGDQDHRLDTGIVFRIRHYCDIGKAELCCNYDVITSPAHDSAKVAGARYRETGETALGGGMLCPSASSFKCILQ